MPPASDRTATRPGARLTWPLERRDSVWQARTLTRCRFRRADLRSRRPRTLEMPKPAGRAGHEHPARAGETRVLAIRASPNSCPFRKSLFLPWGCSCPRPTGAALAQPRNTRAMPIDPRRRDDIAAAVAAYDRDHPDAPLPRNAARLLAVMFPSEDVCQRSLEAIAAEGFSRRPASCDCSAPGRGRVPVTAPGRPGARHLPAAPAGAVRP